MTGSRITSACAALVRRIIPKRSKPERESSRSSTSRSSSSDGNNSDGSSSNNSSSNNSSSNNSSSNKSSSNKSSSNNSSSSDSKNRSYRTSKRTSYKLHEVSESDFEEMQAVAGAEAAPLAVPAPCMLPGESMSVARGPACASADRVREWQLRELEMWPQELRPRNRLQPNQRRLLVVPGRPWGLTSVQEEEEESEKEVEAAVLQD